MKLLPNAWDQPIIPVTAYTKRYQVHRRPTAYQSPCGYTQDEEGETAIGVRQLDFDGEPDPFKRAVL
jgi:hypothetical protein